jgi:hypothetical protein
MFSRLDCGDSTVFLWVDLYFVNSHVTAGTLSDDDTFTGSSSWLERTVFQVECWRIYLKLLTDILYLLSIELQGTPPKSIV